MCARIYVRMYEQNRARDHFSDIRFAAAYPRTLSLTFSRPDVNGSELFFNDLQRCCRVIITTLASSLFLSFSSLFHTFSTSPWAPAYGNRTHTDKPREISNRVRKFLIAWMHATPPLQYSRIRDSCKLTTPDTIVKISILKRRTFVSIYSLHLFETYAIEGRKSDIS